MEETQNSLLTDLRDESEFDESEQLPFNSSSSSSNALQRRNDPRQFLNKSHLPILKHEEQNPSELLQSVTKGRLALSKAQEHIRKFEEHVQIGLYGSSNDNESMNDLAYLLRVDTSTQDDDESFSVFEESHLDDTDFIVQQLIQAKNTRAHRDTEVTLESNISSDCDLSDPHLNEQENKPETSESQHVVKDKSSRTNKRIRSFHLQPNQIHGSKRTLSKANRTMEVKARTDEDLHQKRQFKALPLPDGSLVQNDPYALTSAALGKRTGANCLKTSSNTKFIDGRPSTHRMDAAALLPKKGLIQSTSYEDSNDLNATHLYSNASSSSVKTSRVQNKQLEQMYKSLTHNVADHPEDCDNNPPIENQQDAVALQQELSKLQASLKLKHTQCIHVIAQIHTFDSLNHSMDDAVDASNGEPAAVDTEHAIIHQDALMHEASHQLEKMDEDDMSQTSDESLYTRQRSWLNRVETRRMEAKHRREIDDIAAIQNFSISAVLKNTGKSWIMAKAAHDRAVAKALVKEKESQDERQARDTLISTKLMHGLESDDRGDIPKKSDKKARFNSAKVAAHESNLATSHENAINTSQTSLDYSQHVGTDSAAPDTTDVTIRPRSSDVSIQGQNKDQQKKLILLTRLELRDGGKHLQVDGASQEKKLSVIHLSVNEARKVLMQKVVKEPPPSIPKPMTTKEPSPYCSDHVKVNKRVVKRQSKTHRFQSAAIQAKLYADILSRSMQIRQNRFNHLVSFPTVTDGIKDAASALSMKADVQGQVTNGSIAHYELNPATTALYECANKEEPYQRYEMGKVPFFDRSSSVNKGRFRVRDARYFAPDSIRRIAVPWDSRSTLGVMLLVGRKYTSSNDASNVSVDNQLVITVLFDRPQFNEVDACRWWQLNRRHIVRDSDGGKDK